MATIVTLSERLGRLLKLGLALGLCLLAGLAVSLAVALTRPLPPLPEPPAPGLPERQSAPTADGWALALHHYPPCALHPCAPLEPPRPPVILCHGLAMNRYTFDLAPGRSLARALSDAGLDVWIAELRGHGESVWTGEAEPPTWGLREYIEVDVPVIIDRVRALTGAETVSWVGHSMGGVVLFGHLARQPDAPVSAGVAMGSPGDLRGRTGLTGLYLRGIFLALIRDRWPVQDGTRLVSRLTGRPPLSEMGWEIENIDPLVVRQMLAVGFSPVTAEELRDFRRMVEEGVLGDARDGRRWSDTYEAIQTPLLFVTGAQDKLGSPEALRAVSSRVGSPDVSTVILARAGGFSNDYGHMDMMIGDHSEAEVYPVVSDWLRSHGAPASP